MLTNSVYIGAAIYTLGVKDVAEQCQVSDVTALLGLTVFIIGFGIGLLIWCPIAELPSVSRSPVYIGTLVVVVALQPAVIHAKNIGMLLAFRFLTGLFGSPSLALGGSTAADTYSPRKLNYAVSVWATAGALGPAMGPILSGFAVQYKGWTWSILNLIWLCGLCLVVLCLFLPETLGANILHRRAKRLQAAINRQSSETRIEIVSRPDFEAERKDSAKETREMLTGVIIMTFFEPLVLVLNLYISLIYALLYLWFESFPLVFV